MMWALIVLIIAMGAAQGFTLGALQHAQNKNRALLRDQHIAELERDLDMNLPALKTIQPDIHPLAYVLGVIAGLWIKERAQRGRRW